MPVRDEEAPTPAQVTGSEQGGLERLRAENARLRAALAQVRTEKDPFYPTEGLLYEIFEATPHFVYAKDLEGRYIMANPAHLALFGVEIGEVIGKDDQQRFGAEAAALLTANDRAVVEADTALQFEETHRVNGVECHYLSTKFPVHEADGSIYAICGISTDITAQKQVEKALRESEARFRLAIDAAPALVYASDLESDQILSIYGLKKLLGEEPAQVQTRQAWMERIHPADLADCLEELEAATATGRNFELEYRLCHRDGHYIDVRENTTVIQDEAGHPRRHVGVVLDISARKQAERELRALNEVLETRVTERTRALGASRDQFARLFHASPVAGGITTLAAGRFLDVNERFTTIVGYEREEIVGNTATGLGLWRDPLDRERMIEELVSQGELDNHELKFRTRSGEERTALASVELIEMDGEPCLLGMYVDITERIQAEQQIQALAQALTLAEQRERRRLSAILHNDLQQLLFSLEMQLHLLKSELEVSLPPEQKSTLTALSTIERVMERALSVTRTLSLELNPPVLRSEGLEAALAWLASHMAERHRLQVDLEMAEGIDVTSEERRILLVQFVRELLFNVVKHAGSERALVSVTRENEILTLTVSDDGCGFDMATILNRELREEETKGLGLFSIRERLGLFGGKLQVESEPGQGTCVTIRMPVSSP